MSVTLQITFKSVHVNMSVYVSTMLCFKTKATQLETESEFPHSVSLL